MCTIPWAFTEDMGTGLQCSAALTCSVFIWEESRPVFAYGRMIHDSSCETAHKHQIVPSAERNWLLAAFQALGRIGFFLRFSMSCFRLWNLENCCLQAMMALALFSLIDELSETAREGASPINASFMLLSACSLSAKPKWLGTQTIVMLLVMSFSSHLWTRLLMRKTSWCPWWGCKHEMVWMTALLSMKNVVFPLKRMASKAACISAL